MTPEDRGRPLVPEVEDLLRQAAEWRLIGRLFERPHNAWRRDVALLGREVRDVRLIQAAEAAAAAREGSYLGTLGPSGVVSDREVGHNPLAQPGALMSNLAAFYRAFGYAPRTEEPLDHVSVEAGFVAYLRLKEAFALAEGDTEAAHVTRGAVGAFVSGHLSVLGEPLAQSLAGGPPHLDLAAQVLVQRTGPSMVPRMTPPDAHDGGCDQTCGSSP